MQNTPNSSETKTILPSTTNLMNSLQHIDNLKCTFMYPGNDMNTSPASMIAYHTDKIASTFQSASLKEQNVVFSKKFLSSPGDGKALSHRSLAHKKENLFQKYKLKSLLRKKKDVKKRARFDSNDNTVRALPLERSNMTDEERSRMFYSRKDFSAVDHDILQDLQALRYVNCRVACLPHDKHCLRGLEMKSSRAIHRHRRLRIYTTIRAVLEGQEHCRHMQQLGVTVDFAASLATISKKYTAKAKMRAKELGWFDSIEANLER